MRHEPSCQEKAGGGAAGLGRPQFGISSLFVIHTEENESRCRSRGKSGEEGREAIIKDTSLGQIDTVGINLKQYL